MERTDRDHQCAPYHAHQCVACKRPFPCNHTHGRQVLENRVYRIAVPRYCTSCDPAERTKGDSPRPARRARAAHMRREHGDGHARVRWLACR